MRRLQALAAVVVVVLVVGGAAYADREIAPEPLGHVTATRVPTGAWYCPHGGGPQDWEVGLQIANPGPEPATVRIRSMGEAKPDAPVTQTIEPGALVEVPVDAVGRERSSMVEWFDRWVAVGWISHAGGEEGGVAAEPCSATATGRWLLPDASTATEEQDDYVIVMNPTARDAVVSFTLLSERKEPVQKGELTDVVLKPFHSMSVKLGEIVAGEDTVGTIVEAATGRIVASTLGVTTTGGIRSALGYAGDPPAEVVFPGGEDAGRTQLAVMSTSVERVELASDVIGSEEGSAQAFAGVADAAPPSRSARTFATTTTEPSSVIFRAAASGVAAVRRTFGVVSDQGASIGGTPASAWVILPAVSGAPSHPRIAITNPSDDAVEVTLSAFGATTGEIVVVIPARASVLAAKGFMDEHPDDAFLAVSSDGTFVPAAASYSRGKDGFATFAVASGIPLPPAWVPS